MGIITYFGLMVVLVCAGLVAHRVREKRRKARRSEFLKKFNETREAKQLYKDHAEGEWWRDHLGHMPEDKNWLRKWDSRQKW